MNKNFIWIRDYWQQGKYLSVLSVLFGRMPNYIWDLCFGRYDEDGFDRYKSWSFDPKDPMFLRTVWREPFHFLGGMALTLPFFAWPAVAMTVSAFIIIWKFLDELGGDAHWNPDIKNLIDWISWSAGSLLIAALSFPKWTELQ